MSAHFFAGAPALAGFVVVTAGSFAPALGQPAMMQQPATSQAQAPMPPAAPVKMPATNAAPMLPPSTLGQYGNILTPGDQVAHPLKLKMPFPGVGEVKIPSQDELTMRDKLEALAKLSDAEIRSQLEKWPAYGKMSLRDQGSMLVRIQDFRDYRANVAKMKAHDMGLLTLTPDQSAKFEKEYWDRRLKMEHELTKQFAPIIKAQEQQVAGDLYKEYSAVSHGPMVPAPKPTSPPPPKPPVPMQPVAQAPQ